MPAPKMLAKRNLILDIGTGDAAFVGALKKRYPKARVLGIDSNPESKARVKMGFGAFFMRLKKPERIRQVWMNHVDISSSDSVVELQMLAKAIPAQTPIFLTVRKEKLQTVKNALAYVGLSVRSEKRFNPTMLGSTHTKNYYRRSKAGIYDETPIRLVAFKPGKK